MCDNVGLLKGEMANFVILCEVGLSMRSAIPASSTVKGLADATKTEELMGFGFEI